MSDLRLLYKLWWNSVLYSLFSNSIFLRNTFIQNVILPDDSENVIV